MTSHDHSTGPRSRTVRWIMVVLGLVCVGLGGIGAVVPGLPTTIFLILASYFFARSCPPLDDWLRSNRLFKPYSRYLDRREPMPMHAIVWTLALIWVALGFSAVRLRDALATDVLVASVIGLGLIASASVVWFGRISIRRASAREVEAEVANGAQSR